MSYPGSFFHDDASDSTVKAGGPNPVTSRRRTVNPARARQAVNAHPAHPMMDLQHQQHQQTQQKIDQLEALLQHFPSTSGIGMLQTDTVQTAPRGSRLEIKRVDEVYDASRQMFVIQEGYKSADMDEKNEPFAEHVLLVWRKIVPPQSPAMPPTTHTSIDVKSDYLKDLCQNVIGGFMGISWLSNQLRVRSLQSSTIWPQRKLTSSIFLNSCRLIRRPSLLTFLSSKQNPPNWPL